MIPRFFVLSGEGLTKSLFICIEWVKEVWGVTKTYRRIIVEISNSCWSDSWPALQELLSCDLRTQLLLVLVEEILLSIPRRRSNLSKLSRDIINIFQYGGTNFHIFLMVVCVTSQVPNCWLEEIWISFCGPCLPGLLDYLQCLGSLVLFQQSRRYFERWSRTLLLRCFYFNLWNPLHSTRKPQADAYVGPEMLADSALDGNSCATPVKEVIRTITGIKNV